MKSSARAAVPVRARTVLLPPFHPHRVRFEQHFTLRGSDYVRTRGRRLHVWQNSRTNLKREIRTFCSNATFIWYSGQTRVHDRGCVMAYQRFGNEDAAWYIGYTRHAVGWQRHREVVVER